MEFRSPRPEIQIDFYKRLQEIRQTHLQEALSQAVEKSDIRTIDLQLHKLVDNSDLQLLAKKRIRGEVIFPVPYLLEHHPFLLGYYRLLLGISQKDFYSGTKGSYGFSRMKSLEEKGRIHENQKAFLLDFCKVLCESASLLLRKIEDIDISQTLFSELTLLTLGAQLRGGRNNILGQKAIEEVFRVIREIVKNSIIAESNCEIQLKNAAGRKIIISFSQDPDIAIREQLKSEKFKDLIAIEIKGGTDISNAHNRLGEAEKSHQKAKNKGFTEFWTLISFDIDREIAMKETPTTKRFYYLPDLILEGNSPEYQDFRENLVQIVGISD